MKFDRQLRPATETSWVVSYGGKSIPRWRTAAILKIDISYIAISLWKIIRFSWNFVLNSRFWTAVGWTSRCTCSKWKKVALDRLRVRQNVFLVLNYFYNTGLGNTPSDGSKRDCGRLKRLENAHCRPTYRKR